MELTRHTPCSSFWQDWCTQQAARKESVGGREEGERKTLEIWTSSQRGQHGNHELPRRRPGSEENGQGHLPRKHPHCGMSGSHSVSTDPLTTITFPVKRNYQHFQMRKQTGAKVLAAQKEAAPDSNPGPAELQAPGCTA